MRKLILVAAVSGMVGLMPTLAGAAHAPQSSRDYMQEQGTDPGVWAGGSLTNRHVKDWSVVLPGVDCQSSCHYAGIEALRQPVDPVSKGFSNIFGVTPEYTGNQYPFDLLTNPGNSTKHAQRFQEKGCGGCHSPAASQEFLGDATKDIVGCKSCHNFKGGPANIDPTNPTGNLHSTHVPFIQVEQLLADPGDAGKTACNYCHNALTSAGGIASCWNCHLSGHWPKTANGVEYWQPTALPVSAPALPAVPALP